MEGAGGALGEGMDGAYRRSALKNVHSILNCRRDAAKGKVE